MNYILHAPNNGEINFGLRHGSVTLKHGAIVPESDLTRAYPEFFRPMPEDTNVVSVTETVDKVKTNESTDKSQPEKRKAGRPKKNFGM